jgi:AraC-like DNA-binding protein
VSLLEEETVRDEPGQDLVLDRLLDLLLVAVLRAWFTRPDADAPAWYRAHADSVVGPVLRLIHGHPAHPWTVAALAARSGVSRATLARRFTDLVGTPPMAYLTAWRIDLAADLLANSDGPSTPLPARSGTAARSRSAPPSSGSAGSAHSGTATAPDGSAPAGEHRHEIAHALGTSPGDAQTRFDSRSGPTLLPVPHPLAIISAP